MSRLLHYTAAPLVELVSKTQEPSKHAFEKPTGLWLSVEGEDDWASFCTQIDIMRERLALAYEIKLSENANVLYISDARGLEDFTRKYEKPVPPMRMLSIDWVAVARDYQGIIIAPYIWSKRLALDTSWYYAWDCASGCIWDAAAIASFVQVPAPVLIEEPAQ